jgi:adenylate kinase family enzyme
VSPSPARIHILGASGSGTSTLGHEVARRLGCAFLDTDDFYWLSTDPPYERKRPVAERLSLLRAEMLGRESWVLAGSLCGWGDVLAESFDAVVFLELERSVRMDRLQARERKRYGARIEPGGDRHASNEAFLEWAAAYDEGDLNVRSRRLHTQWLEDLPPSTRVVRLDSNLTVDILTDSVFAALARVRDSR